MMRHMYLILDCSESMSVPDLKPTRLLCTLKVYKEEVVVIVVGYTPHKWGDNAIAVKQLWQLNDIHFI